MSQPIGKYILIFLLGLVLGLSALFIPRTSESIDSTPQLVLCTGSNGIYMKDQEACTKLSTSITQFEQAIKYYQNAAQSQQNLPAPPCSLVSQIPVPCMR